MKSSTYLRWITAWWIAAAAILDFAFLSILTSPALAQTPAGVINAPIYATGYISQVGGTNVTTNILPQPNHPTNLNIYTTGAISGTWTIKLPNPAFEGQILSFTCGLAVNAISVQSSDGSSLDPNIPTACISYFNFTLQFDLRSNIWRYVGYNAVKTSTFAGIVDASIYTGADIGAKINAAITANPGARIFVPPGTYTQSTPINFSNSASVECSVSAGNSTSSVIFPACVFKAATATTSAAICYDNIARGSALKGIAFEGAATVLNMTDGITWACNQSILEDISVSNYGRDGVVIASGTGINPNALTTYLFADSGIMHNVVSNYNKRDGFYFYGSDSNVWSVTNAGATANSRYGYNITSPWNTFITPVAALNTTRDYNIMTYTRMINSYCEATGPGYYIDVNAAGTIIDTTTGTGLSGTCSVTGAGAGYSLINSSGPGGTGVVANRLGVAAPGSSYGYSFSPNVVFADDLTMQTESAVVWDFRSTTKLMSGPGWLGLGLGNGYTAPTRMLELGGAGGVAGSIGLLNTDGMEKTALRGVAANTPVLSGSGFSLTGSSSAAMLDLSGTWNTSGTGTGLKVNVTNTASNFATSMLMDLQVAGSSVFSVRTDSVVQTGYIVATGYLSANSYISGLFFKNIGGAPTASSCGTAPSVNANSTNGSGQFTTGTGAPTTCTLTFANAWGTDAFCTISPANAAAAGASVLPYISAHSGSAFTVTLSAGTSSATFNYSCAGK